MISSGGAAAPLLGSPSLLRILALLLAQKQYTKFVLVHKLPRIRSFPSAPKLSSPQPSVMGSSYRPGRLVGKNAIITGAAGCVKKAK